jgi:O-antigen/teichoic acid export membrane protein
MTNLTAEDYQKITKRAAHGMGWNYLSFGASKAINLLTLAILAHLLIPENFGLVALAALTMDYLSVVSDLGLGAALIQRKINVEESAGTAFILNMLANSLLTLLLIAASPYVASFFREPKVIPVLSWLSLTLVLNSAGSVHNVLLQRRLEFKKKLIPDLGASAAKAIVSLGLAWGGFGVWALVAGQLVAAAVTTILLWAVIPWRPRLSWNPVIARELFTYGVSIMGNNALSAWEDSFDYLIIGKFYNTAALGIYTIAYRLPETLVITTLWIMTSVLFPTFSALQDAEEALKRSFLTTVRYVELLVTPICAGMIIAAGPIIRVAFGEQWLGAVPILRVLALYAWIMSIAFHAGDIYKAVGRSDILIKTSVPIFVLRLIALWIGAQFSLLGVAVAHLVVESISAIVRLFIMWRMIHVSPVEIARQMQALLGAAALALLALPALYLTSNLSPIVSLAITSTAGAVGYIGMIWLVGGESLKRTLRMFGLFRSTGGDADAAGPSE